MKHNNIQKALIFYLDNELSNEKRTAVEKHMEECAECRSFLVFLQENMQVIENEKNPEPSPFFYTRLSARLDQKPECREVGQLSRLLQPAFFSLILVLGIYSGLRIGSNVSNHKVDQQATTSIQMLNDFKAEPIESFLLDEL